MGNNMIVNPVLQEIRTMSALRDRKIYVDGDIEDDMALEICHYMQRIYEEDCNSIALGETTNKEITLLINTYGGVCWSGNSILGMMDTLKKEGYKFKGIVQSKCFSMGFFILCNCDERYGYSYSEFMVHQLQMGVHFGAMVKAQRSIDFAKKEFENYIDKLILNKNISITKEQMIEIYEKDLDWFMLSEEALELNVIQEII